MSSVSIGEKRRHEVRDDQIGRSQDTGLREDTLFMGIVLCINGQMLTKYLNSDLKIHIGSTVGELKETLLKRAPEIEYMRGFTCPDTIARSANNIASSFGITNYRKASFKINDMYFGTPSNCDNILDLNVGINDVLNDETSLSDVYREYQDRAHKYLESNNNRNRNLKSVVKEYQSINTRTGKYFFYNEDNPDIKQEHRPYLHGTYDEDFEIKTTDYSLCWLVVNIECNTFKGGKPRNKNKKTKKPKRSKKTISRRIK